MAIQLRDYQVAAQNAIRGHFRDGVRRVMLCLPTGAGKTVIAGNMLKSAVGKGSRVLFVADRTTLIQQASHHLNEIGVDHGILMSGYPARMYRPVQVGSAQTLQNRNWFREPDQQHFDMVIVDEAHTTWAAVEKYLALTGTPAIGLSATPLNPSLGKTWQALVNGCTTNDLIASGWLVPLEIYNAVEIDTTGLQTNSMGEWRDTDIEQRAIPITGDIVTEWQRLTAKHYGGPVPSIVFSATVDHGRALCREFAQHGFRFEQISYRDRNIEERQEKILRLRQNKIHGLVSVEALAKGFDVTSIRCVVMARPYRKSLSSVIQAIGRGMRIDAPTGKDDCLLIDHAGNYYRHMSAIESFFQHGVTELSQGRRPAKVEKEDAPERDETRKCKSCGYIMAADAESCPACGAVRAKRKIEVVENPGTMVKLSEKKEVGREIAALIGDPWPHICRMACDREDQTQPDWRYGALKWSKAQYKSLMGYWPDFNAQLSPCAKCDPVVHAAVTEQYSRWIRQQHAIRRKTAKK